MDSMVLNWLEYLTRAGYAISDGVAADKILRTIYYGETATNWVTRLFLTEGLIREQHFPGNTMPTHVFTEKAEALSIFLKI